MNLVITSIVLFFGCSLGQHVDQDGKYSSLFPKTPLSDSPCIEDQDCVVSHLIDGQCCSDPPNAASHLYTKDQFEQLLAHQRLICNDQQDPYTCPEHAESGHIEYVYQGACVEQRCVKKKVPADAPHIPRPEVTKNEAPQSEGPANNPQGDQKPGSPIETAASPRAD